MRIESATRCKRWAARSRGRCVKWPCIKRQPFLGSSSRANLGSEISTFRNEHHALTREYYCPRLVSKQLCGAVKSRSRSEFSQPSKKVAGKAPCHHQTPHPKLAPWVSTLHGMIHHCIPGPARLSDRCRLWTHAAGFARPWCLSQASSNWCIRCTLYLTSRQHALQRHSSDQSSSMDVAVLTMYAEQCKTWNSPEM